MRSHSGKGVFVHSYHIVSSLLKLISVSQFNNGGKMYICTEYIEWRPSRWPLSRYACSGSH